MSRDEYKRYNQLKSLLWFAYGIPDREMRLRAVGNIQSRLAEMMQENS